MPKPSKQPRGKGVTPRLIVGEAIIYTAFVAGYYFLFLHFLGGWLKRLFEHKVLYAIVALALICAQGVLLELITAWSVKIFGQKRK